MEFFPPAKYILPKSTQHAAYFDRTEIKLFCKKKKKRCRRNSLSFIAENKEILRDVVITNHERLSSSAFPRLTRPWPGFEAEGRCPSMQDPGCLT